MHSNGPLPQVIITMPCNYFGSDIKYSVLWMKYFQGLGIVQNLYKIFILLFEYSQGLEIFQKLYKIFIKLCKLFIALCTYPKRNENI